MTSFHPVATFNAEIFHAEAFDAPAWVLPLIAARVRGDVRIDPLQWNEDPYKTVSISTDNIEAGNSNFTAGVIIERRQSARVHPDATVSITVRFNHPDDFFKGDFERPAQRDADAPAPSPFGMTESGLVTVNGLTMRQAAGD